MSTYFMKQQSRIKSDHIKIKEMPNFSSPQRISQLNFSFNEIRVIPIHITSVINLQIIDLSHNKISKIQYIHHLLSIKSINLSYNLISEVPTQIAQLAQIQNFDLSFNKIALLNNIKVLKQLVQIRILDCKGSIQINLEGNQILKKKGCKEIYNKWIHPSPEDYKLLRINQEDGYIHLTKKRNSKSLDFPLRDSSTILTHRTHLISQKIEEKQTQKNIKREQKNNSVMKHSIQVTQKLSPNFINSQQRSDCKDNTMIVKSQILNSFQNIADLSKINEQNPANLEDYTNLGQWFCFCIDQLNDLKQKFEVVSQNEDVKRINYDFKQRLHEQSKFARNIIQICLKLIKEAIENSLSQQQKGQFLKQIENLDIKIKSNHFQIIRMLKQTSLRQNLSIKLYKMWVFLYRKLKTIISQIPLKILIQQQNYLKQQQIQQLINISPDKQPSKFATNQKKNHQKSNNQSNAKISPSKDKLNELLFSNKSQCLLLSDQKQVRSNSQKKASRKFDEQDECQNCLMLKWLNTKGKEQLNSLGDKLKNLEKERNGHIELIKNLQKFKEKYLHLADKQQLIIGQLQYLNPSTYQNFLLEQAKTIQYMLNTADLVDYTQINKNTIKESNSKTDQIRQYTSKQIYKDKQMLLNTRLSSSKNGKMSIDQNSKVSQFSVQGKKGIATKEGSNTIKGSSYFKNKNIITTINQSNEDPKTQIIEEYLATEQNKPKKQPTNNRQQVVVSQFNSHINSNQNTSSKNKNVTFQNFYTENNNSKEITLQNNRKASSKQKGENDIILISQGSQMKNICLQKLQTLKNDKKDNKNKMLQYLKSQQFNSLLRDKIVQNNKNGRSYKLQRTTSFNKECNSNNKNRKSFNKKHSKKMNSQLADKQNIHPNHPNLKRNKTTEQLYQDYYQNNTYIPMQSQEADNYKKYVKYHLRNNIMEILFKKNNYIDAEPPEKYLCVNKNQKLIKKNSTQRSNFEEESKHNQINRTFR